ncbi:hypothetical protein pqer_cds_89 [Pandoravirus quercus]|uniref:Uncharacterized protein n=1 Tax=Pandoravirus quercus TaxID=2107709 RepID=A0A2U7U7W0_9VIRU|nr:hypothetical protein pqer_cds_89 [Pandoravirus quercus]AVK74511.1 hypothetical protein pqer_cds_89 [Pandoravirus quercus]
MNLVDDTDGGHDDLYEDVLTPPTTDEPSYLAALPPELASLVAADVARSDIAALERLTRAVPAMAAVAATTPVRLTWASTAPTVRLPEAARLAQALGARGLDDIALLARRCVLLAYVDWVATSVPLDAPAAAMAARALVASAQGMSEPGLLRLIVGQQGDGQTCPMAAGSFVPVLGLGAPFDASEACLGRIIHPIDSATMNRLVEVSLAGHGINGRAVSRWIDNAVDAYARQQCPGAFIAAPAAMPRFSDLFAIDGARITLGSGGDNNYYLVGRLRPRW